MIPTPCSPRRCHRLSAAVGLLAALAVAGSAGAIDVFVTSPSPQSGVFGEVTIEAEVLTSEPNVVVVFRVDGEVVGRRTEPPWRLVVDVGQDNVPHTFEVIATDASGETATARVVTRTIAVDDAVDLELQQLYVTVNRGPRRVLDLPRSAFTVIDERQRQELVTFERGDVPLTAAILVDSSLSMRGPRIRTALEGVRAFASGMRDLDEASLMLFSDRLLRVTPFTSDASGVAGGLDAIQAEGGTAVNDFLYAALKRLDAEQGRRVVILLSDGTDVESVLSIEDVLWKARRSQALVYWIRLLEGGGTVVSRTSAWRDAAGHAGELSGLARLVSESGGRIVDLQRIEDAPGAFREVLSELRDQYVLGYYPTLNLNDGRWHRVQVRVDGPYTVRAREGYVDY
ncbi:MAG TPA: VWA domain-containing protein [Thermoanaerobaculia bacterium]|nr:VWA domain-containing protein [Thermoanaerobaculia bacterium]